MNSKTIKSSIYIICIIVLIGASLPYSMLIILSNWSDTLRKIIRKSLFMKVRTSILYIYIMWICFYLLHWTWKLLPVIKISFFYFHVQLVILNNKMDLKKFHL